MLDRAVHKNSSIVCWCQLSRCLLQNRCHLLSKQVWIDFEKGRPLILNKIKLVKKMLIFKLL